MTSSRTDVDVLIVGGGPAGSSVAWGLRGQGLRVAVLDKAAFPRNKVCAGWITPAVARALELDLSEYARGRILQPINGFLVGMMGARANEIRYDQGPVSYGIRRCEFDEYLLRRCGAELWLGQSLARMERQGDRWLVNDVIGTRLIVGAGGHFCPVARVLGARLGQAELVVAAQEIEFEMTAAQRSACAVRADTPELYFCPDLKGYGWIFRKGDWLNVGLGREDNHRLGDHVAQFCEEMRLHGRVGFHLPRRFHGHAYLLSHHAQRPLAADGALLVGDATGLAYPQSGEGIRPAVESGLLAARTILSSAGEFSERRLNRYADVIARRFGPRTADAPVSAPPVVSGWRQALARYALSTRWFNRHVVIDRWFLHRHQPALS
ncbi:MAG: NAD(P)/FAD-dependent oxidoreductase [Gammaproteobacteria bacterium]|nr:NAD(P)/FAD-dependent oxidoreductase [Gammaproteobacteria bacterium]